MPPNCKTPLRTLFLVVLIAFSVPSDAAQSTPSDDCSTPLTSSDYTNVDYINCIQTKAKRGDPEAQILLGTLYKVGPWELGRGSIEKSPIEATNWYRKAAEQGYAEAQYLLGCAYSAGLGSGVSQDRTEAKSWFRKAADQNHSEAMNALGHRAFAVKDYKEAAKWLLKAAQRQHASAQKTLSLMFQSGEGVKHDNVQAYMWLSVVVPSKNYKALQIRQSLEKQMTPEQIAKAKGLASLWRPTPSSDVPASVAHLRARNAMCKHNRDFLVAWRGDYTQRLRMVSANVVREFLSARGADEERLEGKISRGSNTADLDADGQPEIVLVWTTMGPTYWHNNLTVFSQISGEYKPAGTLQLRGEAKLLAVKDGVIIVKQVMHAKQDPVCCPTVRKEVKYRWDGRETIFQLP